MKRYIDTDELKEWVENWLYKDRYYHNGRVSRTIPTTELYDILKQIPTADVVERKRGKWIKSNESALRPYMCSECGALFDVDTVLGKLSWQYCPACGAEMKGEDDA